MRAARIFVSGYFGFGNLGDEAILEAVVSGLRQRHPAVEITAVFGPDRASAERLGLAVCGFFDLDASVEAIGRSDLVLFGLGGVFQDYWGAFAASLFREGTNGVEAYTRPALLARMAGIPAALFCGGVGPLRTLPGRAMFRMACDAAELVLVRDQASAAEVRGIAPQTRAVVAADPAHLSSASEEDRRRAAALLAAAGVADGAVVVAARAWDFVAEADVLAQRMARALQELPSECAVVFVPFHCGAGTDDRAFAEAIRRQLPRRRTVIVEVATAGEAIALFERAALVVAARNHAVVLAGCAGTPAVALSYDPKVAASAEALGLDPLALEIDRLERLPQAIVRAREEREHWVRAIAERRAPLLALLDGAFASLARLLERQPSGPTVHVGPASAASRPWSRLRAIARRSPRLYAALRSLRARLRAR